MTIASPSLPESLMMPGVSAPRDQTPAVAIRTPKHGPILVATDGTPGCDAALNAAAQLTASHNARVILLSAIEPMVVLPPAAGVALAFSNLEQAQRTERMTRLFAQMDRTGTRSAGWTIRTRCGDPASAIASVARDLDATLVITGLGHHDLLDRVLGSENTLRIVRASKHPVLAVANQFDALPTSAVVATDFSVASLESAQVALKLFPNLQKLFLVHVTSHFDVPPDMLLAWEGTQRDSVPTSFEHFTSALDLPSALAVETMTLQGKASREILNLARRLNVDLIVTGSRGAGLMNRLLVGSTATGIIRGAECAVLAVPASPGSDRIVGFDMSPEDSAFEVQWAEVLHGFTQKNAGRRASLEVDDPDYGLLFQEHGYPLQGVAYDHHDKRVEIMLGDLSGTERHLTRGISNVRAVDVLRDTNGRDLVLRIAHGRGQTLLTLEN